MSIVTLVGRLPLCDFCWADRGIRSDAHYDVNLSAGSVRTGWADLCDDHYREVGSPTLGTGHGQRLVKYGTAEANEVEAAQPTKAEAVQRALDAGDWDALEDAIGDGDLAEWL